MRLWRTRVMHLWEQVGALDVDGEGAKVVVALQG